MMRFAVLSDVHFHDPEEDFGVRTARPDGLSLRPLSEIARKTRLFNETAAILDHVVAEVAARGIRLVVLLGDLSDDGQAATLARLARRLADYERRYGIRFLALPGNHDVFGESGRHRSRRFLDAEGGTFAVTSDEGHGAERTGRITVSAGMRTAGYGEMLALVPSAGLGPRPGDLHWESPYGTDPDLSLRRSAVTAADGSARIETTDASYLVEPVAGFWFLMIDANVFVPHDRAERHRHHEDVADPTEAGWAAVARHRPQVFDWIADVARRAEAGGKRLLAFCHYPLLDPRGGSAEEAVMGRTALARRIAPPGSAERARAAGLRTMFAGHLHADATITRVTPAGRLTEIAMPSLAAFPMAWKEVRVEGSAMHVTTVPITGLAVPAAHRAAYRTEAERTGDARLGPLAAAETVQDLALAHARLLVTRRHLRRDWPADLAEAIRTQPLSSLLPAAAGDGQLDHPALDLVTAWYLVRMAGEAAIPFLEEGRIAAYLDVAERLQSRGREPDGVLAPIVVALRDRLSMPPAQAFRVDLETAGVSPG